MSIPSLFDTPSEVDFPTDAEPEVTEAVMEEITDETDDETLSLAEEEPPLEDEATQEVESLPTLDPGPPAKSLRVMHFGDVHLGVENYGRYNPETGLNTRLEDFTRSLNAVIDSALEAEVDIAVFAGDAYKARDPNQTHQRAFAGALKRLTDNGVPVVMLVGNHDIPNTRGRAHALEIYGLLGGAGVTVLQRPEVVEIQTRKGSVLVAGMPYLTRSRVLAQEDTRNKSVEEVAHLIREKYVDYIADLAKEVSHYPHHIAILTGHFTLADSRVGVQGFLMNPNEPQVSVRDTTLDAFDYVAMGHVHKFQDLHKGSQPPVIYSGSIDRIDFGERDEPKGYVLVEVRKGHAEYKHVTIPTRPFVQIEIDTGQAEDPTRMILEEISRHAIKGAVVRLTYRTPPEKVSLIRADEIRKSLGAAHLVAALSREMPLSRELARSEAFSEQMTPEKALALYLELQPRLAPRKDELIEAARPLFEALEQEERNS